MNYSFVRVKNLKNSKLIYSINNNRSVRRFSLNNKKFSFEDHMLWMRKILKNKQETIYFVKKSNRLIGILRSKKLRKSFYLSWVIKNNYRGKGHGKEMLKEFIMKNYKSRYLAKIHNKNIFSIKVAKYSGLKKIRTLKNFSTFTNYL